MCPWGRRLTSHSAHSSPSPVAIWDVGEDLLDSQGAQPSMRSWWGCLGRGWEEATSQVWGQTHTDIGYACTEFQRLGHWFLACSISCSVGCAMTAAASVQDKILTQLSNDLTATSSVQNTVLALLSNKLLNQMKALTAVQTLLRYQAAE